MTLRAGSTSTSLIRWLANSTSGVRRSSERLSSGLRINRASDDAAGLSVASNLSLDSRVYSQGVRNLSDGISAVQIASGAIDQLGILLTRIQELAVQASNGILSSSQRRVLDLEAQQLRAEYDRIASTTRFNGFELLSGVSFSLQGGYGSLGSIDVNIGQGLLRGANDGTFSAATTVGVGMFANGKLADVNNDGKLDLVGVASNRVSVLLGNGDGTFSAARTYVGSSYVHAVVDLNRDGVVDLIGGVAGSAQFAVLLGNGDGTYRARSIYTTPFGTASQVAGAVGDFNGDGRLDYLSGSNGLTVSFGNGDGTFLAAMTVGTGAINIAVADFNRDGLDDFVVGTQGTQDGVYLSNGNGSFRYIASPGLGPPVATGDLNGDGIVDYMWTSNTPSGMNIYIGNGDGTFRARVSYVNPAGGPATEGVLRDMNDDGALDAVVFYDGASSGYIGVFFNNGDGTFQNAVTYSFGGLDMSNSTFGGVADIGDINGDGRIDIVSADVAGQSAIVLLGNGSRRTTLERFSLTTVSQARSAIDTINQAQQRLFREQGNVGSILSRIEIATGVLRQSSELYLSSAAQILDADVAEETSRYLSQQILQRAASALLTQSNIQGEIALLLLRG